MDKFDLAELKALELSKSFYVILIERTDGVLTLIPDPGLDRPWASKNKRLADSHAADYQRMAGCRKAAAVTIEEAFDKLTTQLRKNYHKKNGNSRH